MFIQTEVTPNPATLKFLPGRTVLGKGTMEFTDPSTAGRSMLAVKLFAVHGVTGVFYGSDFITVTKDDSDWQHLKPAILGAIMYATRRVDWYAGGARTVEPPVEPPGLHEMLDEPARAATVIAS